MSATGQAAGGEGQAQQGDAAQQSTGPDVGQLAQQLEGVGSSLEEMRAFLASNPWQQQAEQQQDDQGQGQDFDLSFLDDPTVDQPTASQRLNEVLNGAIDQRSEARIAPIQQQMIEMRRDQQARDLAAEFPELAKPEVAQLVAGRGGLAEQAAQALGQPGLAAEPAFWRIAYMAHKAAEAANNEGSGDPGAVTLESANGAGPGPSPEDHIAAIKAGGGVLGARVLDF